MGSSGPCRKDRPARGPRGRCGASTRVELDVAVETEAALPGSHGWTQSNPAAWALVQGPPGGGAQPWAPSACPGLGARSEGGTWCVSGLDTQARWAGARRRPGVVRGPGEAGLGPHEHPPAPWTPPGLSLPGNGTRSLPATGSSGGSEATHAGRGLRTCTAWRARERLKSRMCPRCTERGPWRETAGGSGSEETSQGHGGLSGFVVLPRARPHPRFLPQQGLRAALGGWAQRATLPRAPLSAEERQLSHPDGHGSRAAYGPARSPGG